MDLQGLINKFDDIKTNVIQVTANSLKNSHEAIMLVAKEKTPVKTGALQASGEVQESFINGNTVQSKGSFGNDEVVYALEVHEDLQAHHENGQAKFYSSAVLDMTDQLVEQLAVDVMKLF